MLQLKDPSRGFSFSATGPLDMRMDDRLEMTAADFLRTAGTERVRQVLERYGEVRFAGRLARTLTEGPETPEDTAAVVRAVERALPTPFLKTRRRHPATAVFQALRIAVNDELGALERALPSLFDRLAPGGLFLVISFHSLEDRLVKTFLKYLEGTCTCPRDLPRCVCHRTPRVELLTRKPLAATERETAENPPSRSAKLRVARKLS
jgi:16S rRNA (cytosine1402-N4)-methyltransferase